MYQLKTVSDGAGLSYIWNEGLFPKEKEGSLMARYRSRMERYRDLDSSGKEVISVEVFLARVKRISVSNIILNVIYRLKH